MDIELSEAIRLYKLCDDSFDWDNVDITRFRNIFYAYEVGDLDESKYVNT